jgi:hypothetical protein
MDENPYQPPQERQQPRTFFESLENERRKKIRLEKWTLTALLAIVLGLVCAGAVAFYAVAHRMDPIAPRSTGLEPILFFGGLLSAALGACALIGLKIWKRFR